MHVRRLARDGRHICVRLRVYLFMLCEGESEMIRTPIISQFLLAVLSYQHFSWEVAAVCITAA